MSKVEKLLGLDGRQESQVGEKSISVQKSGYMLMKNLNSGIIGGAFKKRYCVIKDSFFLWYPVNTHQGFDQKPKGVLPLNAIYITQSSDDKSGCVIEMIHPDITGSEFLLKAEDKVEAQLWLQAIEEAQKFTWEKARLGFAMLEQLKAKGTKNQAEKERAVAELKEKAQKLDKVNRDHRRILERKEKAKQKFDKKIAEAEKMAQEAENNRKEIEEAIRQEEALFKQAAEQKRHLENKISMATMALRRLETSFELEFDKPSSSPTFDQVNVKKSVNALKSFFESTFEAHKVKQEKYVGKKLEHIGATLRRKKTKKRESMY